MEQLFSLTEANFADKQLSVEHDRHSGSASCYELDSNATEWAEAHLLECMEFSLHCT